MISMNGLRLMVKNKLKKVIEFYNKVNKNLKEGKYCLWFVEGYMYQIKL
jgi:hypothetical protein